MGHIGQGGGVKRAIVVVVILAAAGAAGWFYYFRRGAPEIGAQTSPITRGDIVDAVSTTGTLQAVTTVQIGSQVSGNISYLGADFNSIVKRGQVIARLDPSLLQAQVEQSRANVLRAQADVAQSEANLARARVALLDAQQKYGRAKQLEAKGLQPQADMDAAKIAVDSAQSSLQSAEAALNSSKASVSQSQASFNQAQVNLEHTIITSPVDGIVTQRSVDVGQTVAASMQAPTLFVIAVDLTKLQVSANIDEADIGRIRPGQRATFRVDAYPTDTFEGTVAQVRLQPVVVQNVTTYATIINAPNAELKLRPGMTATLRVEVSQRSDVLRVPSAALRFRPTADVFAALNQPVPPEALGGGRGGRGGRGGGRGGLSGQTAGTPEAGRAEAAAPQAKPSGPPSGAAAQRSAGSDGQNGEARRGRRGGGGFPRAEGGGVPGAEGGGVRSDGSGYRGGGGRGFRGGGGFRGGDGGFAGGGFRGGGGRRGGRGGAEAPSAPQPGRAAQGADTIDALFAPLPPVESRGTVWTFADKQLKPVNVRLGITDGINTELLGDSPLSVDTEVVTGMTGLTTRGQAAPAGAANPFQPQGFGRGRGRGGPGF
jgi:HlyD family secretion protein